MTDRYPDQECDSDHACTSLAVFDVYVSYDTPSADTHQRTSRYRMPWARTCPEHLGTLLHDDLNAPGSTHQWTIRTRGTR